MSKILKTENLPLFSIIDLDELRRANHLDSTILTDFYVASNQNVYLLMGQPPREQGKRGKDWTRASSVYTVVEIKMDWMKQQVLQTALFSLGLLKFQFHYLRPAGDHFLLLGARCAYRKNGPVCGKKRWHHHYQLL